MGTCSRRRFSLIELLVVVCVIAMLTSLLLPALGKARETAKSINCVGNLKQLHLLSMQYANDWNEFMPPAYCGNNTIWVNLLAAYVAPKKSLEPSIYMCPSNKDFYGGNAGYTTYGLNVYFGSSGNAYVKIGRFPKPSMTLLLGDHQRRVDGYFNYFLNATDVGLLGGFAVDALFHQKGGNYVMLDGHHLWLSFTYSKSNLINGVGY